MAMTAEMKRFLHERGLTAIKVAERSDLIVPKDIYGMLRGKTKMHPHVKEVLCNVYGMTEKEYAAAIPNNGG